MATTNPQKQPQPDDDAPAVMSAPPPWHSVAVLGLMVAFFVSRLPSLSSLDETATVETFTNRVFPQYVDLATLAYIRAAIAAAIWFTSFHTVVFSKGWEQKTSYGKESKLKMVPNVLVGRKTMYPFTSWAWNLLGVAFTLSSYVTWLAYTEQTVHPWLLRAALVAWEIAAPFTLLVAAVIRYVIWPAVLQSTGETKELKHPRNWMMHNANVLFATAESALLGGLPVNWRDVSLAPLVGCAYILFTWNMTLSWGPPEHGVQFIYFFLDTTLPGWMPTIALLALLAVLLVFFAIFCVAEQILQWAHGGILAHLAFVVVMCSAVVRFWD